MIDFPFRKAIVFVALEILFLIIIGLLPWIDNFSHIGGFFFGICIGTNLLQSAGGSQLLGCTPSPVRRCIHFKVRMLLCSLALALCATNALWLHQSQDIGDLPCRKCRYMNCAPLPMFQKFCEPCHYIRKAYTTERTDGKVDIELHCPYGEITLFVTETEPTERDDWVALCKDRCEH